MPAKPDIIATEEEKKPDNEDGVLLYLAIKVKEDFKDDEDNDKMRQDSFHTRKNMGQKCEGNCDLWVLNEIIENIHPENLKKMVGAVWELPEKQHSQSSPI